MLTRTSVFRSHSLVAWSRGFTEKEYAKAGRRGCAEYPSDKFPWS